jgi:DNA invertase Pin-like site-specific DNA recombinase
MGRTSKLSKETILTMQKTHRTDSAIGKVFGITRQAVYQMRKKYRIPFNVDKNKERDEAIIQKYRSGISGTKLARDYKLSFSQTYRIIRLKG